MKVIVTGWREWPAPYALFEELDAALRFAEFLGEPLVVVHGACPTGADRFAAYWVSYRQREGRRVEALPYPADWAAHGRGGGPIRNRLMVNENMDADLLFAFLSPKSRGTVDCRDYALSVGQRVKEINLDDVEDHNLDALECEECFGDAEIYEDLDGVLYAYCPYCALRESVLNG